MSRNKKVGGFHTPFGKLAEMKAALPAAAPEPLSPVRAAAAKVLARPTQKPPARPSASRVDAEPAPRSTLSDEELFLREMQGTAPMPAKAKTPRVPGAPADTAPKKRVSEDAEVLAELADLVAGDGAFDISDSDEYIEGMAPGVDRRLLKRLRAGDYALQGHVDLHGLTREEAKARVSRFIDESRRAGQRCVLIVHGRGLHSKDQIPVLKEAVRTWLERGAVARAVLAFATARPHDGGAGAVYVLLRR
jgi:DNA-nicking Smr family endonuclease